MIDTEMAWARKGIRSVEGSLPGVNSTGLGTFLAWNLTGGHLA
jgi:hypothetical protein